MVLPLSDSSGCASTETFMRPPSAAGGTMNRSDRLEDAVTRALCGPTNTRGGPSEPNGRSVPSTSTRPPGTAQRGVMAERTCVTDAVYDTSGVVVVELDVPVDVVAPALGRFRQAERDVDGRRA